MNILCLSQGREHGMSLHPQDVFVKKVTEVHERINEQSMEDDYVFMTEEDMIKNNFPETLSV